MRCVVSEDNSLDLYIRHSVAIGAIENALDQIHELIPQRAYYVSNTDYSTDVAIHDARTARLETVLQGLREDYETVKGKHVVG